jgi:CO/xanthine dehydrogenase FAD-binding subunit
VRCLCPSDLATGLATLNGEIHTVSPRGVRKSPISQFYAPPVHILEPDEIITNVHINKVESNTKKRYLKFLLRKAINFSIVSVCPIITFSGYVVKAAKIVMGESPQCPVDQLRYRRY